MSIVQLKQNDGTGKSKNVYPITTIEAIEGLDSLGNVVYTGGNGIDVSESTISIKVTEGEQFLNVDETGINTSDYLLTVINDLSKRIADLEIPSISIIHTVDLTDVNNWENSYTPLIETQFDSIPNQLCVNFIQVLENNPSEDYINSSWAQQSFIMNKIPFNMTKENELYDDRLIAYSADIVYYNYNTDTYDVSCKIMLVTQPTLSDGDLYMFTDSKVYIQGLIIEDN